MTKISIKMRANKSLTFLLTFVLIATLLIGVIAISNAFNNLEEAHALSGTGTSSNPYLVSTRADL